MIKLQFFKLGGILVSVRSVTGTQDKDKKTMVSTDSEKNIEVLSRQYSKLRGMRDEERQGRWEKEMSYNILKHTETVLVNSWSPRKL